MNLRQWLKARADRLDARLDLFIDYGDGEGGPSWWVAAELVRLYNAGVQ